MRRKLKFILFILILIVGIEVSAQTMPKDPPEPKGPPKPEAPIDEELPILILIATVFGIYRIYRYNHKINLKEPF